MSTQDNGGSAFPASQNALPGYFANQGMSLRDYFASKAMQAFLSQSHRGPKDWTEMGHGWGEDCANQLNCDSKFVAKTLADFAYQMADLMLAERSK